MCLDSTHGIQCFVDADFASGYDNFAGATDTALATEISDLTVADFGGEFLGDIGISDFDFGAGADFGSADLGSFL